MWSKEYSELINRNIGFLNESQQDILRNSSVAVFGLGGLGGVISELLTRCGIGSLKIVDNDVFEAVNLNRQIFSFRDSLGRLKIDVTEEFLKKINPEIKIEKYSDETEENIEQILEGAKVSVLAIDKTRPCLIISRSAKKLGIPLIEGWAIPFGNVRVFTEDTPSLEEVYQLPTQGKEISSISEEEFKKYDMQMLAVLNKIKGAANFYTPQIVEKVLKGEVIPYNPTFAPIVWLTACLMSLETIKVILNLGEVSLAPKFSLYNPFENKIPKQEI